MIDPTTLHSITFAQVMTVFGSLAVIATLAKPIYAMTRLPDALNNLAEAVHELKAGQEVMVNRIGNVERGEATTTATLEAHGQQLQNHENRIGRLEDK